MVQQCPSNRLSGNPCSGCESLAAMPPSPRDSHAGWSITRGHGVFVFLSLEIISIKANCLIQNDSVIQNQYTGGEAISDICTKLSHKNKINTKTKSIRK